MVFFSYIYTFSITFTYKKARELMFVQYPGLKSSCRSLWAGLPFPLAVTFGRRRAVHSFGSDRFVQPGAVHSPTTEVCMEQFVPDQRHFACPPFRRLTIFLIPTWFVGWFVCSISPFAYIVNRLSSIFSKNWGSVFRGYYEQGKNSRQDPAGSAVPIKTRRLSWACSRKCHPAAVY